MAKKQITKGQKQAACDSRTYYRALHNSGKIIPDRCRVPHCKRLTSIRYLGMELCAFHKEAVYREEDKSRDDRRRDRTQDKIGGES